MQIEVFTVLILNCYRSNGQVMVKTYKYINVNSLIGVVNYVLLNWVFFLILDIFFLVVEL